MTAVMQSSTASIAVTLSAYQAGAIGVDQDCAPIIGQNIGTATSSAMAAQAKRKGKILAKHNRPGRQNCNILAPPRPKPSPYRSSSFRFLHDERR
jgi:Na+/Pi-cotransporter